MGEGGRIETKLQQCGRRWNGCGVEERGRSEIEVWVFTIPVAKFSMNAPAYDSTPLPHSPQLPKSVDELTRYEVWRELRCQLPRAY